MERYCDVVMKGGITSGVVYPLAAVELAKEHRFRNVGGTSAGAIAAAAVAAAEFGRRSGANPAAYDDIAELPDWLGRNMLSLFQPSRRMRPLFNTMLSALGTGVLRKLLAPLNGFPLAAIAGLLPAAAFIAAALLLDAGLAMRIVACAVGVLVLLPVGVLAAIGASLAWRLRALPESNYGLCPGNDPGEDAPNPPLTRWLADFLDKLAGKRQGERPLTFGDLWGLEEPDGGRGVNLQMVTTCLTQERPYSLPFEGGEKLWFKPEELLGLFPQRVVAHMVDMAPGDAGEDGLLRLPPAEHLPVVVAARMSLSFPLLIGAVPLYAENHAWEGEPRVERCWFSDGGITSNFPVHFFDSPVPRWPTFAIDLVALSPDRELSDDEGENVWLAQDNHDGIDEAWVGWGEGKGFGPLLSFLNSVFRTAQNWIDNRQMRGPGYRDRIAHVRLAKDEGGMNLTMKTTAIERLAERGRAAAAQLSGRFGPQPPAGTRLTWENQRWIRYRAYMTMMEQQGERALLGMGGGDDGTAATGLGEGPPVGDPERYGWSSEAQKAFAIAATADLLGLFEDWEASGERFGEGSPRPPVLPWQIPRI